MCTLRMTNIEIFEHSLSAHFNLKTTFRKFFDTCFKCCGRLVLFVFHFIYSCSFIIRRGLKHILNRCIYSSDFNSSEIVKQLKREVLLLEKVPTHLVFNLALETVSYIDVVKIIGWCLPAGIAHISFYNVKNDLDPELIFVNTLKHSQNLIQRIKWGKHFNFEIKHQSEKCINGYVWKPELTVNVYKREDGLESLVEVVKDLHHEGTYHIDRENLNTKLLKRLKAPDPDLVVVCGKDMSIFGLLPWHLRVTQFLLLDSHHYITVTKFMELLKEYSICEQRYGK